MRTNFTTVIDRDSIIIYPLLLTQVRAGARLLRIQPSVCVWWRAFDVVPSPPAQATPRGQIRLVLERQHHGFLHLLNQSDSWRGIIAHWDFADKEHRRCDRVECQCI